MGPHGLLRPPTGHSLTYRRRRPMTPLHERLRLRQDMWDRVGDSYASTLVHDGLRLARWSGPPTDRLVTTQLSPVTKEATHLVATLLPQGAIVPCKVEDLCWVYIVVWGVSALIMVPKKDGTWRTALNLKPLNLYLHTTYFTLPTLKSLSPLCIRDCGVCPSSCFRHTSYAT